MLKIQYTSLLEAGTDEAGRGALAGPVTAAAVVFPIDIKIPLLNDSKKLTENQRYQLRPLIEKSAIDYAVAHVFQEEIDEINILRASIKAMHLAIKKLKIEPQHIVVDGNKFNAFKNIPHTCFVKGDGKFQNIAAASILAKTYRDDYMKKINFEFPKYQWNKNKGYPTISHRNAIKKNGITKHHRASFKLFSNQLKFDL